MNTIVMTKNELIDKIILVMKRKGAQPIRMSELPSEAQINSKVLKQHFKNKEDIFEACVHKVINDHKELAEETEAADLPPIVKVLRIYKNGLAELFTYHPSFFFHLKKHYPELNTLIETYNFHLYDVLIPDLLQKALENEEIIENIDLPLFCSVQLAKSRLLFNYLYAESYHNAAQLITIFLTNIRGIMKKEHLHLFDSEVF